MAEEFQQKEGEISPLTQSLCQYWSSRDVAKRRLPAKFAG